MNTESQSNTEKKSLSDLLVTLSLKEVIGSITFLVTFGIAIGTYITMQKDLKKLKSDSELINKNIFDIKQDITIIKHELKKMNEIGIINKIQDLNGRVSANAGEIKVLHERTKE